MSTLLKSLFVLCLVPSAFAGETSDPAEKQQFLKVGLSMTKGALENLLKDLAPADSKGCPAGGTEVIENLRSEKGKIFSIMDRVDDVRDAVKPALKEKEKDNRRCGSCKQSNVVSLITSISPEKTTYIPECTNRPAETLTVNLESKDSVKNFIEDVLKGKNSEGKRLYKGCPDPCSFYVTTGETEQSGDRTYLTLTVQCGQPRAQSIISAKYDYNSGLVHQWTCSK